MEVVLALASRAAYMQGFLGPPGPWSPPFLERSSVKLVRPFALIALVSFLAVGCSESSSGPENLPEDGPTLADLVGSWTASSHTYTNNANSSESFDVVANGGETRTTVLVGGGHRTWFVLGDFMDEWDAQLSISGETLTSTPVEVTRDTHVWTFTLVGTTLTLTRSDSEWDFTLSGAAGVPATEVVVFVKQP
jgi:hypothetical protein